MMSLSSVNFLINNVPLKVKFKFKWKYLDWLFKYYFIYSNIELADLLHSTIQLLKDLFSSCSPLEFEFTWSHLVSGPGRLNCLI